MVSKYAGRVGLADIHFGWLDPEAVNLSKSVWNSHISKIRSSAILILASNYRCTFYHTYQRWPTIIFGWFTCSLYSNRARYNGTRWECILLIYKVCEIWKLYGSQIVPPATVVQWLAQPSGPSPGLHRTWHSHVRRTFVLSAKFK